MFVTIHLRDDIANGLNQAYANLPEANQLLQLLTKYQVDLQPMQVGVQDAELQRQFYVTTDTDDKANHLVNALLELPCVIAAYIKSPDAVPTN